MKINWGVRIRNKTFWLSLIPALLLLSQSLCAVFGYQLDLGSLGDRLLQLVNAVFVLLGILGIVNDPTTQGLQDSPRALHYQSPQ